MKINSKKAQITLFIITGIIILALIILFLFLKGKFFLGPVTPETLPLRLEPITEHLTECVRQITPDYIKQIGLQGGFLVTQAGTYRLWKDNQVSYLCYNIPNSPLCYNRALTKKEMEKQLSQHIQQALSTCIDLNQFRGQGYELITSPLTVDVDIQKKNVFVNLHYPILLRISSKEVSRSDFSVTFEDYPLGELYEVSQDIVNTEAVYGDFDQLTYMLAKRDLYIIEKRRPYPDKLYILKTKDNSYVFQFFIQGEPS